MNILTLAAFAHMVQSVTDCYVSVFPVVQPQHFDLLSSHSWTMPQTTELQLPLVLELTVCLRRD